MCVCVVLSGDRAPEIHWYPTTPVKFFEKTYNRIFRRIAPCRKATRRDDVSRRAQVAGSQPRFYKNNNSGSVFRVVSHLTHALQSITLFLDSLNTTGRLVLISRGLANRRRDAYLAITKEPSEKT
ncbi:hypothetical protein P5V15_005693 [Pogonomyrmex californicus]